MDFSINEMEIIEALLADTDQTASVVNLREKLAEELEQRREIEALADECLGGACKL